MNLVLFEPDELGAALPLADRRVRHVLTVLKRNAGESFDAGVVNGARGKATLIETTPAGATFSFVAQHESPRLPPVTLLIGLPRPQTARDILRDATTLGVSEIHFVRTERGEPSYAHSALWTAGEWRRHALLGAEQAFDTRLPAVTAGRTLANVIAAEVGGSNQDLLALDNYEATCALEACFSAGRGARTGVTLAIGAERGWSSAERELLRNAGFTLAHLGRRVLRAETAVIAALALAHAALPRA